MTRSNRNFQGAGSLGTNPVLFKVKNHDQPLLTPFSCIWCNDGFFIPDFRYDQNHSLPIPYLIDGKHQRERIKRELVTTTVGTKHQVLLPYK